MRTKLLAGTLVLAAVLAPAAAATSQPVFTFGRHGGNIQPFTASIYADGRVTVTGSATRAATAPLQSAAVAGLVELAAAERFSSLPRTIACKGALPDIATVFVRARNRTVSEHGGCTPRFDQLFAVLWAAAGIS